MISHTRTYLPGRDITQSTCDVLVNTVNTRGVMGKGVAKAFRDAFPHIVREYLIVCRNGALRPGGCPLFALKGAQRWAALATKDDWRDPSQYAWIASGLSELALAARRARARSIALPPPGCGNGGLDWAKVEPMVLHALADFDLEIYAASTLATSRLTAMAAQPYAPPTADPEL